MGNWEKRTSLYSYVQIHNIMASCYCGIANTISKMILLYSNTRHLFCSITGLSTEMNHLIGFYWKEKSFFCWHLNIYWAFRLPTFCDNSLSIHFSETAAPQYFELCCWFVLFEITENRIRVSKNKSCPCKLPTSRLSVG